MFNFNWLFLAKSLTGFSTYLCSLCCVKTGVIGVSCMSINNAVSFMTRLSIRTGCLYLSCLSVGTSVTFDFNMIRLCSLAT